MMTEQRNEFDDHLKLAEFYMEVRKNRQQHEWRVSVGLWAGLAAGIVTIKGFPTAPLALFLLAVIIGHGRFGYSRIIGGMNGTLKRPIVMWTRQKNC
jgi:hypothetical protein